MCSSSFVERYRRNNWLLRCLIGILLLTLHKLVALSWSTNAYYSLFTMNKIAVESENYKGKDSLVNGTSDREACQKRWVAAIVQINCERKIASKLDKLGIANYVPIQNEVHQWSDRKRRSAGLLYPWLFSFDYLEMKKIIFASYRT